MSPMPMNPNAPPSPSGLGGISSLLGPQIAPSGPNPRVSGYMTQVRELHMTIDALAQEFPEAAEDLKIAKESLTASMSKVASAMASPENIPQPPVL